MTSDMLCACCRGELKVPCALKKIKGPVSQKEVIEFVREGEMMRKVKRPFETYTHTPDRHLYMYTRICIFT